jgi:hypothetical protein
MWKEEAVVNALSRHLAEERNKLGSIHRIVYAAV